jgi:ubiquinone/menaquinone biosynthesis C-methylase UbiE
MMMEKIETSKIIEVFRNVHAHRLMANLIRKYSTNRSDIREIAIDGLNLSECRNILDLGCGFGFFTEALKGRVHPRAVVTGVDVIGGYEGMFLETCMKAGLEGRFLSAAASQIKDVTRKTFDLILCSYALYFFTDAIPDISRILAPHGIFIVITHDRNNMKELISITKEVLSRNNMLKEENLPLEKIIAQFSSENGMEMLKPWFGQVAAIDYRNSLVFRPEDDLRIIEYFLFKSPFLLSGINCEMECIVHLLSIKLQQDALLQERFTLSKNDRIFICSSPLDEQGKA